MSHGYASLSPGLRRCLIRGAAKTQTIMGRPSTSLWAGVDYRPARTEAIAALAPAVHDIGQALDRIQRDATVHLDPSTEDVANLRNQLAKIREAADTLKEIYP